LKGGYEQVKGIFVGQIRIGISFLWNVAEAFSIRDRVAADVLAATNYFAIAMVRAGRSASSQ
jgi:hypothetical protein